MSIWDWQNNVHHSLGWRVVLMGMILAGCFRDGHKSVLTSEATSDIAEQDGSPLAFSINIPLVDIRADPVGLSWSPSTSAFGYDVTVAREPSCADQVASIKGLTKSSWLVEGLAEGSWFVCVTALGNHGERREADNDGAGFVVDRTAPLAAINLEPSILDNPAYIDVGGDDVSSYRFKAGPATTIDCASESGYSDLLFVKTRAHIAITGTDQQWTFCVVGADLAGNQQDFTDATTFSWLASSQGRRFVTNLPSLLAPSDLIAGKFVVKAQAVSGWSDPSGVQWSLSSQDHSLCLNDSRSAFSETCPHYVSVDQAETFTFDLTESLLVAGNSYELRIEADDLLDLEGDGDGRRLTNLETFGFKYHFIGFHGDDDLRVIKTVLSDGDLISCGTIRGGVLKGTATLPAPEKHTSYDVFLAKNTAAGEPIWAKRFSGQGDNECRDLVVDSSGDSYFLATYTQGFESDLGVLPQVGSEGLDIVLAKVGSSDGATIWQRALASPLNDQAGGVVVTASGALVSFGSVCGSSDFGSGTMTYDSCQLFVGQYQASDGALSWFKSFASTGDVIPGTLTLGASDSLYLTASFSGTMTLESKSVVAQAKQDGLVAKLDSVGALVWSQVLAGSANESLKASAYLASADQLFVAGLTTSDSQLSGVSVDSQASLVSALVARLNPTDGSLVWSATSEGGGDKSVLDLTVRTSQVYLAARISANAIFGSYRVWGLGGDDLALVSLDASEGSFKGADLIGGRNSEPRGLPRWSAIDQQIYYALSYGTSKTQPVRIGDHVLPTLVKAPRHSSIIQLAP